MEKELSSAKLNVLSLLFYSLIIVSLFLNISLVRFGGAAVMEFIEFYFVSDTNESN